MCFCVGACFCGVMCVWCVCDMCDVMCVCSCVCVNILMTLFFICSKFHHLPRACSADLMYAHYE